MFKETEIKVSKKIFLHFINIKEYSIELIDQIKLEIIKIWDGDLTDYDLRHVKSQIRNFLKSKSNDKKLAFVAEFICHLYLRTKGFEQYSLLKNLEEVKAPKKGFDGLYEKDKLLWILESKAAIPERKTPVTHNDKVGEAYRDLKEKIEINTDEENKNNPWENAKSHFILTQKRNESLSKQIKSLSKSYEEREKMLIDNYNVIPCSTIYLDENYFEIDSIKLEKNLKRLLKNYKAKLITVICINKKSIDNFIEFINED